MKNSVSATALILSSFSFALAAEVTVADPMPDMFQEFGIFEEEPVSSVATVVAKKPITQSLLAPTKRFGKQKVEASVSPAPVTDKSDDYYDIRMNEHSSQGLLELQNKLISDYAATEKLNLKYKEELKQQAWVKTLYVKEGELSIKPRWVPGSNGTPQTFHVTLDSLKNNGKTEEENKIIQSEIANCWEKEQSQIGFNDSAVFGDSLVLKLGYRNIYPEGLIFNEKGMLSTQKTHLTLLAGLRPNVEAVVSLLHTPFSEIDYKGESNLSFEKYLEIVFKQIYSSMKTRDLQMALQPVNTLIMNIYPQFVNKIPELYPNLPEKISVPDLLSQEILTPDISGRIIAMPNKRVNMFINRIDDVFRKFNLLYNRNNSVKKSHLMNSLKEVDSNDISFNINTDK